jgi:hypothetical protein
MKRFYFLSLLLSSTIAFAQINVPKPSPLSTLEQKVGLTDVTIAYSRPSKKGRMIFGDLVPYGKMWRTGANASTKITFDQDVKIEGNDVPAGTYALYTIPGEAEWEIILHKNLTYWGTGGKNYKTEEDQLRFKVKPNNAYPVVTETMTINLTNLTNEECVVELLWDKTQVTFKLETEVDALVQAEIDEKMKGVTKATYYQAARYYLENGKDLNQALEWINLSLVDNEKYWIVRQKALILAKLERYEEAIEAAELSKKLAEGYNEGYVKMNQKSIEEWSKKVKKN